ncbi:hypothetical protein ACH4UR_03280 [Streptomyces lydicus]|uniref:hypothetical protein n=1 Tax=Streptomyces lydicus TaxID=47763 RepID=UPI0033EAAE7F
MAPVDAHLEELTLAYLDRHFFGIKADTAPWRGRELLAGLRKQQRAVEAFAASGEAEGSDVHNVLTRLARIIRSLEQEESDHLEAERKRNLLRGWHRGKWGAMGHEEKREVIAQVLTSVVVLPIPEGVSDKAPFDPTLLRVSWREDVTTT